MRLFEDATDAEFDGWRKVTLEGSQVQHRFLNERGVYEYGSFELSSETLEDLEAEIVDIDPESVVTFAIIDAGRPGWSPEKTAAFRQDLDFYVFTSADDGAVSKIELFVSKQDPAAVLCLTTPLDDEF